MNPRQYVVYVGFLALMVVFSIALRDAGFLSVSNLVTIVQQSAPITVMAVGMVLVLTTGQIDLSIGAVVALAALVTGVLLREFENTLLAVVGLGVGAAIGLFNGLFTTLVRVPSFLVTLASMGLVSGLARTITNLQVLPIVDRDFNMIFGSGSIAGVSTLVSSTIDPEVRRCTPATILSTVDFPAPLSPTSATISVGLRQLSVSAHLPPRGSPLGSTSLDRCR